MSDLMPPKQNDGIAKLTIWDSRIVPGGFDRLADALTDPPPFSWTLG